MMQPPANVEDSGLILLGDNEPNEFSAVVLGSLGGQLLADTQARQLLCLLFV